MDPLPGNSVAFLGPEDQKVSQVSQATHGSCSDVEKIQTVECSLGSLGGTVVYLSGSVVQLALP